MKTGKVARALGIDRKTVSNWTEIPQLKKYFSGQAQGMDRTQREYLESDLLILNTIRVLRGQGRDWDAIASALEAGELERNLPANAMLVETTAPIAQYGRIVELQTALESAEEQISQLQDEIEQMRNELSKQDRQHQESVERLMNEAREREGKLQREIGKLEALIDIFKEDRAKPSGD